MGRPIKNGVTALPEDLSNIKRKSQFRYHKYPALTRKNKSKNWPGYGPERELPEPGPSDQNASTTP